jgi:pyruvate/2-oxoglutarate dehydrogenase complex dihydrolipoamide dehydrogenase (E3) component
VTESCRVFVRFRCNYASPEIASVGLTEKQAKKRIQLKLVNSVLSFRKAKLLVDGFVKVILTQNTVNG